MTRGADIIAAIILLALAIAIIVYLLHWLYRRSSKEVSFVRTGMLGEKVVISGGAFVLPIIHNITQVGMRTLSITIKRGGDKSLITKDRMRAELVTEFFTKVPPDPRAVSTAAQTLGNRTLDPEHLREVVQGRFADALGEVAAKMTLDEIQENRGQFVKEVTKIADGSIGHTGLALETVSIISLDQTPIEQFNPANTFDSQGLTQLTEQIETRKKKRNDITQDTKISIENKNLETIQKELEIKKNEEFSKFKQEREVSIQKAKRLQIEEHQKELEIIEKSKEVLASKAEEQNTRAKAVEAEEKANSTRYIEKAEGIKQVDVIEASAKAEQDKHATMAAKLRYEIDAAGKEALNLAENVRSDANRRSALRIKLAEKIESIIRESVKPMANIGDIKIVDVSGLPGFSGTSVSPSGGGGSGTSGGSKSGGGNLADNVVSSALRYRAHQPFLDSLLKEIGMNPGEISNIRNILGDYGNPKKDYHMNFGEDAKNLKGANNPKNK